jgi:hypothetical protein
MTNYGSRLTANGVFGLQFKFLGREREIIHHPIIPPLDILNLCCFQFIFGRGCSSLVSFFIDNEQCSDQQQ